MSTLRMLAVALGILVAVLVGAFFVIAALLPSEREFQSEHVLCYDPDGIHESLSEPAAIAEWFFPGAMDSEVLDDGVRWEDGEHWLELQIQDSRPPGAVDYELKQPGRFEMPFEARLEAAAEPEEGSLLTITGHASAETAVGRWFLVLPDVLGRFGLPHQSFEDAMGRAIAYLEEYLEDRYPEC